MAAQPPGSAFPDTAAVPLADGRADDCAEEVRQACGTAGIYGMILCKTEKFPGYCCPRSSCPVSCGTDSPCHGFPAVYAVDARVSFLRRMYQERRP